MGCTRTQSLLIEHDDGVDRVTLNRPDSLNALNPDMIDALNGYFEGLQRNRATRVVVLKGAGASFCAANCPASGDPYSAAVHCFRRSRPPCHN